MKLSNDDKGFILGLLDFDVSDTCESYRQSERLVLLNSEKLKSLLSPEQLSIYETELANRDEMEDIITSYYFFMGLKLCSHVITIASDPAGTVDALFGDL